MTSVNIKKIIEFMLYMIRQYIVISLYMSILVITICIAWFYISEKISYHNCLKDTGSEELCQEIQNLD